MKIIVEISDLQTSEVAWDEIESEYLTVIRAEAADVGMLVTPVELEEAA